MKNEYIFKKTSAHLTGFTLVEMLIVLAIMSLLVVISLSTFISHRQSEALNKDTDLVIETLREARNQTISSRNSASYGVHFTPSSITLFSGSTFDPSDPANRVFNLDPSITLSTSLPGGAAEIIFERLSGQTEQYSLSAVTLTSTSQASTTISVYETGVVERASP